MKRFLLIILVVASISVIIISCTRVRKDGDWDDNIKLSVKTDEFTSLADSVIITTKGSWWWISDITVNENHFYGFGINPDSESYIIKQDCFIVERRDEHTLFIRLEENPLNVIRSVTVGLQAGDYFDRVTITQKAKQ
jgi:hypothetical protein